MRSMKQGWRCDYNAKESHTTQQNGIRNSLHSGKDTEHRNYTANGVIQLPRDTECILKKRVCIDI